MTRAMNTPWLVGGLYHVLVQNEILDSMEDLTLRAQKFIALQGVREDGIWPAVPVALWDRPDERVYEFAELPIGEPSRELQGVAA